MRVHEGPVEFLSQDCLPEFVKVPSVDYHYVDPLLGGDLHPERIEDTRFRGSVLLVHDVPELADGHLGDPDGVRVLAGVVGVHGIDRRGVHHPVSVHVGRDHHGHRVRGVTGFRAAHDGDLADLGVAGGLLGGFRDPVCARWGNRTANPQE